MSLYRIIYLSDAHPKFNEDHLDGLLATSRRNNAAEGLTGLLILHDRHFLQVLEGVKEAVLYRYNVIASDWRQRKVRLLDAGGAGRRVFADWSMGCVAPSDLAGQARDALLDITRIFPTDGRPLRADQAAVADRLLEFLTLFEDGAGMSAA